MLANKICLDKIDGMEISVSFSAPDKNTLFTHREIHMHEEYEILVNVSGEKILELSGGLYAFPKGAVGIIRPYEGHRCIFQSEGKHDHFWVLLKTDNRFMDGFFENDESGSVVIPDEEGFSALKKILGGLLSGNISGFCEYAELFTLLDIIKRSRTAEVSEEKVNLPRDVALALEYMEKHISEQFTVETMARASHVSVNTLERHFGEYLQLSPSAVLRRKRLITAAKHLSHDMSVSEACYGSGFTDYSNFIASFRRFYGMTPLKYQKNTKRQN